MRNLKVTILSSLFLVIIGISLNATANVTKRTSHFTNDRVAVWETIIYPGTKQILKMHRHEHDRVLVAFNDGLLKITNDKNQTHYLKLKKNKAYFLTKDKSNELHNDQNISSEPIRVMVIELKDGIS